MTRGKKFLLGGGATVLGLLVVTVAAAFYLVEKSLPEESGTVSVPGIAHTATIARDEAGVPHILAVSTDDAAFALGYAHAQDRLWQMDLLRRFGEGRLSEIFGAVALPADKLARTIGFARIADSLAVSVSAETRRTLEAYARGVNARIAEARGRLPVEFDVLRYEPEPWRPAHSLLLGRLMAWQLCLSWLTELVYEDLVGTFGAERARTLMPEEDPPGPTIIPAADAAVSRDLHAFRESYLAARALFGESGSASGSNCWAVTRSKSLTGSAILANDPHLAHAMPGRWYLAHLSAPGLNVAGFTLPGVPGVVIGHNDSIAWGMTNIMADDADFYLEHVDLRDSTYEFRGARCRLALRVDSIFVRDAPAVPFVVAATRHGPLVGDVYTPDGIARRPWRRSAVAIRWCGAEMSDELRAVARLDRAGSWDRFLDALRTFACPGQNFTYADRHGSIGYAAAALLPLRPGGGSGALPFAGWDGSGEWTGFVPFERLPRLRDPARDWIASANNRPADKLPYYVTTLWESDSRIRRIGELLEAQRDFTAADFRYMQMDVRSPYVRDVKTAFVHALLAAPRRPTRLTRAMNGLAQWDGSMAASSWEACVFASAMQHALRRTFEDDMGADLYARWLQCSSVPLRVFARLLSDTAATWFDDARTPVVETRDDVLRAAVSDALDELSARLGDDMTAWRWGAIHTVTFRHPLSVRKPLDRIFDLGPYPVDGHTTTIHNEEYRLQQPYDAVVGASMRFIVDMGAPDTCAVVLPAGQSGQPFSPHYADFVARWRNGAYFALVSNVAAVRTAGWPTLVLIPAPAVAAR